MEILAQFWKEKLGNHTHLMYLFKAYGESGSSKSLTEQQEMRQRIAGSHNMSVAKEENQGRHGIQTKSWRTQ